MCEVYWASTESLEDQKIFERCWEVLSVQERERGERFVFDRHRLEYVAAHSMLRNVISEKTKIPPEELNFITDRFGKPKLKLSGTTNLHFNLTHTDGLVACAVSSNRVGIDIELYNREVNLDLSDDVLAPLETDQLSKLSNEEKNQRFLQLWTLKEAYSKAIGLGLRQPFTEVPFFFDETTQSLKSADEVIAREWLFKQQLIDHGRYLLAVSIEMNNHLIKFSIKQISPYSD